MNLRQSKRVLVLAITASIVTLVACGIQEKRSLDIPEGFASQTLKEFAKQANVEIVFDAPSVVDIRTNAVAGRMTPGDALDLMLAGTPLVFERDSETGAYAVTVSEFSDTETVEPSNVLEAAYLANDSNENKNYIKFF